MEVKEVRVTPKMKQAYDYVQAGKNRSEIASLMSCSTAAVSELFCRLRRAGIPVATSSRVKIGTAQESDDFIPELEPVDDTIVECDVDYEQTKHERNKLPPDNDNGLPRCSCGLLLPCEHNSLTELATARMSVTQPDPCDFELTPEERRKLRRTSGFNLKRKNNARNS